MAVYLSPIFNAWQGFDANGRPLNAGQIFTYAAGTSTPQATYTTSAGNVPNANPIALGTDGRPPAEIWLTGSQAYKFVLEDSLGNVLGTYDQITAGLPITIDLGQNPVWGHHWTNALDATQNLLSFDAGIYVTYTSGLPNIIYGFASDVFRSAGTGGQFTVGAQFSGYAQSGVTSSTWGVVTQAWGKPGSTGDLIGGELAVINETNAQTAAKIGLNSVFKDRLDTAPGTSMPLGVNQFNLDARAIWISSQQRSTTGEFCGWRRGILFDEWSMDVDNAGGTPQGAIGIDFAFVHYFGGTNPADPTSTYRMTAAIRMRNLQSILWNGLPSQTTEPANAIRSFMDEGALPNGRWKLTNAGTERFGVDMTTGDLYINGARFSGSGGLASNNVWTGTNTFNNNVTIGANLTFAGASRIISGDFTNATFASRTLLQTSTAGGATHFTVIPNGAGIITSVSLMASSSANNCAVGFMSVDNTQFTLQSAIAGAGAFVPMTFFVSNVEAMRLDQTTKQLLIATPTASAVTGAKLRVNGIVQIDNAVAFAVNNNAVSQGIADSTFTKVGFSTKEFDQNTNFDTVNARFTPPAGKYVLSACVQYPATLDGKRYATIIYKNGSAFKNNNLVSGSAEALGTSVTAVVDANGTDFFEVWTWHDSGGINTVSGATTDTWFSGFRIG